MAKAIVVLAEGFEEIEAVTAIDVMRRAGIEVTVAGVGGETITGAHGISIVCDGELGDVSGFDAVVFPGGLPGAENLAASEKIQKAIATMKESNGITAAICASPAYVLAPSGILDGKKATCYPGCEEGRFPDSTEHSKERVVQDGNIITSRGPGTALEFALKLVEALAGREKAEKLRTAMLVCC